MREGRVARRGGHFMPNRIFFAALQKVSSKDFPVAELIQTATDLGACEQPGLARQLYRMWLHHHGEHPQAYIVRFNCAALESQLGDQSAAAALLSAAIAQNRDFLPAYINLGSALERLGAPDKAVEQWHAVANKPLPVTGNAVTFAVTALKQIARVLSEHQRAEAAEEAVKLCLDIDPHQEDLVEQWAALRLTQCKWPTVIDLERSDRKALVRAVHPLSLCAYTDDPLFQLGSADRYARRLVGEGPELLECDRRHAAIDLSSRRLKVGYVSSDLRDHAIGYLMAELFELHDRSRVEVTAYYCGIPSTSELQGRIKAAVEHWVDIRAMSDDAAARKIASDGIDILVDVNGHTRDARTAVFARRPAPILVNWLGYPGTMGTPYHHYIIADDWIIPEDSELFYSEKVVRLPCYQANDRKRIVASRKPARAEAGLPEDAFVFCCFNGPHKITRFTFERWLEILRRVPDSVLWLLEPAAETKNRLWECAQANGVARERVIFAPKAANPDHLARYPLADLFLDTAPYGAHTTASDALWMGVPVLTLSGRSFASRVCGSLVRSAGLEGLVVERPEDYVARAVWLGRNRQAVETYRAQLRANRDTCVLFDMNVLTARLEALYRAMCADYCADRLPQPNLDNLNAYYQAGTEHDHDAVEMLAAADYRGLYATRLARRHLLRPMRPDGRLWTAADILKVEAKSFETISKRDAEADRTLLRAQAAAAR
jgi:predicted O-linked N-acetylglucosamine transferase (SPINDLY family)